MQGDAALADAARKGDTAAFEQLVLRHQNMAMNVAFRITGVYEDACDIAQEAFLAAWRKLGDFRGDARFATWLTSIVINLSRNRLDQTKSRERREAYSLDEPVCIGDREVTPDPPSSLPSALDRMEEAEMRAAVRRCISALDHGFREVLVLRDMQEMSYEDVAGSLGLREGTVKSRLFRARDAVRDCLRKAIRMP